MAQVYPTNKYITEIHGRILKGKCLVSKGLEHCIHKKFCPFYRQLFPTTRLYAKSVLIQLIILVLSMTRGVTPMLCTWTSQRHLTLSTIPSLLRSSGMQVSVAHSLPGSTVIWRADCREWSSMSAHSDLLPVTSSVPQDSILGLLLFVIFTCFSPHARIALFADDAKLYRTIFFIDGQVALQNDLNALNNWSKTWDIDFNAKEKKMCGASGQNS